MRTRIPALLVALTVAASSLYSAPMKSAKTPAPKDALECAPGEISACGLPSNVVIDMSKTKVKRTDAIPKGKP